MILFGLFMAVVSVFFVLMLYEVYGWGKDLGWWGRAMTPVKPSPRSSLAASAESLPSESDGQKPANSPAETLEATIWSAVLDHPTGVWLYSREDRMLRITLVGNVADADAVLYVERIEGEMYTLRIPKRVAWVQLYTFQRSAGRCVEQYIMAKAGGPPDFELEFAHEAAAIEAVTGTTPSDDTLRKLATDLARAHAVDDM